MIIVLVLGTDINSAPFVLLIDILKIHYCYYYLVYDDDFRGPALVFFSSFSLFPSPSNPGFSLTSRPKTPLTNRADFGHVYSLASVVASLMAIGAGTPSSISGNERERERQVKHAILKSSIRIKSTRIVTKPPNDRWKHGWIHKGYLQTRPAISLLQGYPGLGFPTLLAQGT